MKTIKLLTFFTFISIPTIGLALSGELSQMQNYLNSIKTLEAEFKQESDGSPRFGRLYIAKPYRIKWDYGLPKRSLILGNKRQFVYYDPRMSEVTYLPSSRVPGFFLTHEKIEFGKNINVLAHHQTSKLATVDLQDEAMKRANVAVQLIFQRKPIQITGIKVIDWTQQSEIVITFSNLKINAPMSEKTFVFKDPNFFKPNSR